MGMHQPAGAFTHAWPMTASSLLTFTGYQSSGARFLDEVNVTGKARKGAFSSREAAGTPYSKQFCAKASSRAGPRIPHAPLGPRSPSPPRIAPCQPQVLPEHAFPIAFRKQTLPIKNHPMVRICQQNGGAPLTPPPPPPPFLLSCRLQNPLGILRHAQCKLPLPVFRGLRVRIGIHTGIADKVLVHEKTKRATYGGRVGRYRLRSRATICSFQYAVKKLGFSDLNSCMIPPFRTMSPTLDPPPPLPLPLPPPPKACPCISHLSVRQSMRCSVRLRIALTGR